MEFSRNFLFREIRNEEFRSGKKSIRKLEKAVSRRRRG